MEPRAAIGSYDAAREVYTLIAGGQGVARHRVLLAEALGVEAGRVEVVCHDVGGGFGSRNNLHPEAVLVAWAARRLGAPVRWTSDRSEGFLTDFQGRDIAAKAALGFDDRGVILAARITATGNAGASTVSYAPLQNYLRIATTVYAVPVAFVRVRCAVTNTTCTAPFRGAGRPEATYTMERLLDLAAMRLGIDRVEIRRRNLIRKEALPYRTVMGLTYDSGDFAGNMERALASADWAGFPARRAASAKTGRLRGISVANYVESPVGMPRERVALRISAEGKVEVVAGTQSSGQGHETVFAQVVADQLGVPLESITLVTGDTRAGTLGGGSHSNRSMRLGGTLLIQACAELIEKARAIVADQFEAEPEAIEFVDGLFRFAPTQDALDIFAVASLQELNSTQEFFGRILRLSDRLRDLRGRDRPCQRRGPDRALHADRRRRPSDQSADRPRPVARRHRARPGSSTLRVSAARSRERTSDRRIVHGLRGTACGRRAAARHRARRGSDRGQSAARQGRRGRRNYALTRGDDRRHRRCVAGVRSGRYRPAGDGAAHLGSVACGRESLMPALELSAAFTVNERTRPLLEGLVSPEGMRLVTTGITPNEMFWRQLKFGDFDVSEMSMASLLIATSQGPTEWVALPIFTTRRFFHTRAAVRVGAGIERPEDLRGKRVGVPEYQQTAAVWSRGILKHKFGVDPMDVIWFMGRSAERSHGGATGFTPPKGLRFSYVPPETDIAAMLLAGELDATLHYYLEPNLVDRVSTSLAGRAEVRPLFPDALAEGRRYYKKTGIYPINHCVVVRRSIFERNPWVAINLYSAFLAAKAAALKKATSILEPYRETGSLDGTLIGDPMPYGVQACRSVLETIARFLYEQGLTERVVALDEIFAESTLDL